MQTLSDRLQVLANRYTRYELVAIHPDGRQFLVAYCARKSRAGLLDAVRRRSDRIVSLANWTAITFGKRVSDGAMVGSLSIRFSGRTQREALINGELPYIGN